METKEMAVLSKYIDRIDNKLKRIHIFKPTISQALVGAALAAWTIKLYYSLLPRSNNNMCIDCENNIKLANIDKIENSDISTTNAVNNEDFSIAEAEKLVLEKQLKNKRDKDLFQPGLNNDFVKQLLKLLQIMIPKVMCYETGLLAVHTLCLISRTFLSIYVAALEGAIVKYIVRKDLRQFTIVLLKWFGIAIPATFINSMIRFLEGKLSLSFRTRLVRHAYRLYFKNQNYYRVSNLDGRIENADHRLTEDISVFASSIAHLYGSLTKPCFDLMLIGLALMRSTQRLKSNILLGPALSIIVIGLTAHIMRVLSPKFGQLVSEEANRYGYLRHIHSRIITNAEEIAFYGGHKVELQQLRQAYNRLVNQMNYIFTQKLWFIMVEQFFMKYVWSGTGMVMVSLPILMGSVKKRYRGRGLSGDMDSNVSERTQYLTTARNLLISAADAIERMMTAYKEIVSLAGYTYRVASMIEVFEETAQGIYSKITMGKDAKDEHSVIEFINDQPVAKGRIVYSDNCDNACISLRSVPVVTPNCNVVVTCLNLSIKPGMHLLITGPNGCGKSSLFRILSGLWPIYAGELCIPRAIEDKPCMFYIPQRPYMSIGNLCDQIIYPDTRDSMLRKGINENDLRNILKLVSLEHIAQRDSFYVVRDWKDILSGGEKQRMAIARLFYHKPMYALLDECTSALSVDIESSIYETVKNMGITLLTITHRPTLWKFHTHLLEFDGQGGWSFRPLELPEYQRP
ncbi:ATP-binding cassette sub-family D member isoform X2 [Glossina fuscipes]|uniref:ATP-binding cassette sub-family D member isoform X2 n=1 Tax=Glossina fuscipes TaxID=7396 RepID=A0A9C5ZMT3_9MUSC|nr:ATP-binding cassette sub-family D member isoform X2 [Glossina fuscipes]